MCGIIGQINSNSLIDIECFKRMRDTLKHRGPDGEGLFYSENKKAALGHRRLSLIDLTETGNQPLHNETRHLWLTCNGEIYNYRELRKNLIDRGHQFSSQTDSEVILHGYEEWGGEILQHLKGMFAFAIWDERKQKLFLARDRFGIKPLYYYLDNHAFIFASEIKGIIEYPFVTREIDYSSVCDYFAYRYVPSPKTIWKNIFKLPPAHYLEFSSSGKLTLNEYWKLQFSNKQPSEAKAVSTIDHLLKESVKQHIVSDVPVGSFLSGGYDSSALVDYLHRIQYDTQTFSIGFENWKESEHQYAEIVSKLFKTKHRPKILKKNSLDLLEKLSYVYDEPIADISIIPTYFVSELAAENVKAVLSGEGADEIFCGYSWQKQYHDDYKKLPLSVKIKNRLNPFGKSFAVNEYSHAMAMGKYDSERLHALLNEDLADCIPEDPDWFYTQYYKSNLSPVKSIQYMDVKCFMAELVLTKMDRASMANSLEVRVPFLDHELVEFIFQTDERVYYKTGITKFLLFENIKKNFPETILNRPKQGFVGPESYYMNIDWYQDYLVNGNLIKDAIIKKNKLSELILEKDHWRLWKLLVFELWYSRWS